MPRAEGLGHDHNHCYRYRPNRDEPAILLSDRAWRAWFASDPRVTSRSVEIGGRPARIAGVMPPNVSPAVPIAVWMLTTAEPPADVRGFVLAKAKSPPKPGAPRWWGPSA